MSSSSAAISHADASTAAADAVLVVLGAAVWPGGEPSPTLRRRVDWAATLYRQGIAGNVLLTGGRGRHPPAEAEVMADLAGQLGVPAERLIREPQGRTTWDSARRCAGLIRSHGWRDVILVTDPWHLPRTRIAFRAFGIRARGCPICRGHAGTSWRLVLQQGLHELIGLPVYLLRAGLLALRSRVQAGT